MPSVNQYRKIFEEHGYESGLAIAHAVGRTRPAKGLAHNTVYTGINKMVNGRTRPSPQLVEGLREALAYDQKLDALLQKQYGIKPHDTPGSAAPTHAASKQPAADAQQYEMIFQQHGFTTRADVSRAVNKTTAAKHLKINGIHTGLREMVYGKRKPTVSILNGLREALEYDKKLDELLHQQYGIEPAPRQEPPRKGPAMERGAASGKNESALSRLEKLLAESESIRTRAAAAADEAFEEVLAGLRRQYEQAKTAEERIGILRQYQSLVKTA